MQAFSSQKNDLSHHNVLYYEIAWATHVHLQVQNKGLAISPPEYSGGHCSGCLCSSHKCWLCRDMYADPDKFNGRRSLHLWIWARQVIVAMAFCNRFLYWYTIGINEVQGFCGIIYSWEVISSPIWNPIDFFIHHHPLWLSVLLVVCPSKSFGLLSLAIVWVMFVIAFETISVSWFSSCY